jgi:glucokinase
VLTVGVDIGATKLIAGIIGEDGSIVRHTARVEHGNGGPEAVVRILAAAVRPLWGSTAGARVRVGVSVAAQVDPDRGLVVHAPNLGWRDVPLGRLLEAELGTPVRLINDARAAALAEWRHGAGAGSTDLFFLSLGTGVGGSAVVGGRLLEGDRHAAGEVGHLTIVAGGRPCHCPNAGCFEAYVGGWGIADRARDEITRDPDGAGGLVRRAGSAAAVTAQTVFEAQRAGDPCATRLVAETERYLADGAVSVVNAFNPGLVVVGGGLLAGRPEFLDVIMFAIRARCQPPAAGARVAAARWGENAALVGAAEAARDLTPRAVRAPRA